MSVTVYCPGGAAIFTRTLTEQADRQLLWTHLFPLHDQIHTKIWFYNLLNTCLGNITCVTSVFLWDKHSEVIIIYF